MRLDHLLSKERNYTSHMVYCCVVVAGLNAECVFAGSSWVERLIKCRILFCWVLIVRTTTTCLVVWCWNSCLVELGLVSSVCYWGSGRLEPQPTCVCLKLCVLGGVVWVWSGFSVTLLLTNKVLVLGFVCGWVCSYVGNYTVDASIFARIIA